MPYRLLLGVSWRRPAAPSCAALAIAWCQGIPPSARTIEPVVKLDASEARNSAAPMISVGSPARCSDRPPNGLGAAWSRFHDLLTSVRNGPAINVLTRTVGPSARAKPSVIALSPAFADAYGMMSGAGRSDPAVLTLMIDPPPVATIRSPTNADNRNG